MNYRLKFLGYLDSTRVFSGVFPFWCHQDITCWQSSPHLSEVFLLGVFSVRYPRLQTAIFKFFILARVDDGESYAAWLDRDHVTGLMTVSHDSWFP